MGKNNTEVKTYDDILIDDEAINEFLKKAAKIDPNDHIIKDTKRLVNFVEGYKGKSLGQVIEDVSALMLLSPKSLRDNIALSFLPIELKMVLDAELRN